MRHALAHGFHHPRRLHAQLQGHGQRVQTSTLVNINEVQADGLVSNADLTGAGLAHGHIDQLHNFGAAVLVYLDSKAHSNLLKG